jgi:kynurenine formamidase
MTQPENRKLVAKDLADAAEKYSNWSKWGKDDQVGTLNYVDPQMIVEASQLVRSGKVFSLCLDFNTGGPQTHTGSKVPFRFNPLHVMVRTGTDNYSGVLDKRKVRVADDLIIMPLQCGTQWDALSHIFYYDKMWNGYDCRQVSSAGAEKCGIEHTKNRMVGRGVLLDLVRTLGFENALPDGYSITPEELDKAAASHGVQVKRGDFVLIHTGHLESKRSHEDWDGYAGGDAPGLSFETLGWLHEHEVAAVATDTWGVEVRPNNSEEFIQPFHWIAIPMMGLSLGEIFVLAELADDCARDGRYEFFFIAPTLPFTGAVGSPTNPIAIK